jgi:type II secretory ATPase GspE/PulE/Tfp pilus assembly ATPase PilB-like protein
LAPIKGDIKNLIRESAPADALRAAFRAAGHPSLWADGINKVRAGITSLEEIVEVLTGCPGGIDIPDGTMRLS